MLKFLALTSLIALGSADKSNIDTTTTIGKAPHVASLRKIEAGKPDREICGGSIIANEWIVTAAQCILDRNYNGLKVIVGTGNRENGGKIHKVTWIETHDKFKHGPRNTFENDIALIKVKPPFKFDKESPKAIHPCKQGDSIPEGTSVGLSGWGGKEGSGDKPNFLHFVNVKTIGNNKCKQLLGSDVSSGHICTESSNDKYFSMGESGDSITTNKCLVGIASWGAGSANLKKPLVYTKIAPYNDWIEKTMKDRKRM